MSYELEFKYFMADLSKANMIDQCSFGRHLLNVLSFLSLWIIFLSLEAIQVWKKKIATFFRSMLFIWRILGSWHIFSSSNYEKETLLMKTSTLRLLLLMLRCLHRICWLTYLLKFISIIDWMKGIMFQILLIFRNLLAD